MTITKEVNAQDIIQSAWSGARYTVEHMTERQIETVLNILEDSNCGEPMTETQLNDFFWFEDETIAEWLGFDSFEELEKANEEE